jgi:hypothetical protein
MSVRLPVLCLLLAAPLPAWADLDDPHQMLHYAPGISPYHWGAVGANEQELRGVRMAEVAATRTVGVVPPPLVKPLPRTMLASRASVRPMLLASGRRAPGPGGVRMVRRFVRVPSGSLRQRLIDAPTILGDQR